MLKKVKEKVANKDEKVKVRKVGPLYFVDQNWWGRQLKAGLPQDKQEGGEEKPSKRKMQNDTSMDMLLSQGYYIAWPARRTKPTRIGGWGRRTTWGCKLWRSWNLRRFEKFQRRGYGMIETLQSWARCFCQSNCLCKRQSFAKFCQSGVKLSAVKKLLSSTSSTRSATQSTT